VVERLLGAAFPVRHRLGEANSAGGFHVPTVEASLKEDVRSVGGRSVIETLYRCPVCGSTETPKLVVRGPGLRDSGVSHKCRACSWEWSGNESERRAS
jgi:predicted RNA-binding Zn-ribbon protein involved in translation (DUF1610 family)